MMKRFRNVHLLKPSSLNRSRVMLEVDGSIWLSQKMVEIIKHGNITFSHSISSMYLLVPPCLASSMAIGRARCEPVGGGELLSVNCIAQTKPTTSSFIESTPAGKQSSCLLKTIKSNAFSFSCVLCGVLGRCSHSLPFNDGLHKTGRF